MAVLVSMGSDTAFVFERIKTFAKRDECLIRLYIVIPGCVQAMPNDNWPEVAPAQRSLPALQLARKNEDLVVLKS